MDSVMGTLTNLAATPSSKKGEEVLSIEERRKQRESRKKTQTQEDESQKELEDAERKRLERRKRLDALRNS